jgi:hypothetical protein
LFSSIKNPGVFNRGGEDSKLCAGEWFEAGFFDFIKPAETPDSALLRRSVQGSSFYLATQ